MLPLACALQAPFGGSGGQSPPVEMRGVRRGGFTMGAQEPAQPALSRLKRCCAFAGVLWAAADSTSLRNC
eukprot:2564765-Alexandrium_andersonii.AAC.1